MIAASGMWQQFRSSLSPQGMSHSGLPCGQKSGSPTSYFYQDHSPMYLHLGAPSLYWIFQRVEYLVAGRQINPLSISTRTMVLAVLASTGVPFSYVAEAPKECPKPTQKRSHQIVVYVHTHIHLYTNHMHVYVYIHIHIYIYMYVEREILHV